MKGHSRMRRDESKNKRVCCILSKEDLEQTGSFLEVLQTNGYQYEIVFPDLTDRNQQCIRESDRVVFFASQKSVQSESLFHTLRLAADNQKDIAGDQAALDGAVVALFSHVNHPLSD